MALQELLRALREQAAERREAELSHAEAEVERIRRASRAALARRRESFLAGVRRDEEEAARRALSRARADAAEGVLEARERLLERVRERVGARIRDAATEPAYLSALPNEVDAALARMPPGPVTVSAPESLVHAVERATENRTGITVATLSDDGPGFRALDDEGTVEVDGTLEPRLARAWPRIAMAVLQEVAP